MNMDDALLTFITECRELLDSMESTLLQLENVESDERAELLNALFRVAHTIKGSAGLFGLEAITGFTHNLENLLDQLREGQCPLTDTISTLLLQCRDHLSRLIDQVELGDEDATHDLQQQGDILSHQLASLVVSAGDSAVGAGHRDIRALVTAMLPARPSDPVLERLEADSVENDCWHLSLRFSPDCLRDGLDPIPMLNYLQTLGRIVSITTQDDALPPLAEMNPETLYLGFEIRFDSQADKQSIEDVFEFVRDNSLIRLLPPHSRISEYIALIESMPEVDQRLGELLVDCGSLTQSELDKALTIQAQSRIVTAGSGEAIPLGEILVAQGVTPEPVRDAAVRKQSQAREQASHENQSVRVDAQRLDELINLISELVTSSAGTALQARAQGDDSLIETVSQLTALVESVRDAALSLRMVQIGTTFNRFQRVVRDVSRELGKSIRLTISGAETELDKTLVEKIGDPLLHLVRNAIDHGIEPTRTRLEAGKPAEGEVHLNAYHDSGNIILEVADDGAGLDLERIRQKAQERGLIDPDARLERQELFQLIFEPGFSTASSVTNLSGRGVGMDVVRRNITELRGRVEVESETGQGSIFRIVMPLTLAIIDGFLIAVDDAHFVLPLESVLECVELSDQQYQSSGSRDYLNLRGEVLPFIRLREWFDIAGQPPRRENVVVMQCCGHKAGLVVDRLLGEFQTVIKPLGALFGHLQGIGGSTIMGDGQVALILDVPNLVQRVISRREIAHS